MEALPPKRHPLQRTESIEDYLRAIYQLERQTGQAVATSSLADRLGVSSASVTGMVKRLAEAGLVTHEPYAGVTVTDAGRRVALDVIRHHRLIETFLARTLGLEWDEVHAEAHRLEHHISEVLEARMDEVLGHPERDPHGSAIPPKDGEFREPSYESLADVAPGARVVIREVDDDDPERLRYMARLGLRPDVTLVVRDVAPYSGPITVDVDPAHGGGVASPAVGRELARLIAVEVVG
jgi:DtxR family Mn-dependent transcriptional regulator